MTYFLLILILLPSEQRGSSIHSPVGQFAITTDESIVYLSSTGNWWSMDSFVDKTEFFVITEPLIRYDTLQFIITKTSTPVGVYNHIVGDTARVMKNRLSIASALRINISGIDHIKDISLGSVALSIPKCPKELLLSCTAAYANLMLLIDKKGNVTESFILDTSWNSLWNEVSYNTIQNIDFEPIMIDGKAEKTWIIIPISNHIERLPDIIR